MYICMHACIQIYITCRKFTGHKGNVTFHVAHFLLFHIVKIRLTGMYFLLFHNVKIRPTVTYFLLFHTVKIRVRSVYCIKQICKFHCWFTLEALLM